MKHNLTMRFFFLMTIICTTTTAVSSLASASPFRRNVRWALRGIVAEMVHNIFLRPFQKQQEEEIYIVPKNNQKELAIVTGATGGMGVEICKGLVERNYEVLVLARNIPKGQALAESLESATFVEYHADDFAKDSFRSLFNVIGERPVSVLVNNAGVMGGSKMDTIQINLVAPVMLTLSLLSSFKKKKSSTINPVVVNVGSSSHLRASHVPHNYQHTDDEDNHNINMIDSNLSAYAESKLGLMQFSNIVRHSIPWLSVMDAHPGLVWTPLLQNHFPGAKYLERLGLSKLLYKNPAEGAATILAAVDAGRTRGRTNNNSEEQVYFVNRQPGGYASPESNDYESAKTLWNTWLGPAVNQMDEGYSEVCQGLSLATKNNNNEKEEEGKREEDDEEKNVSEL